jgi:hypothetical protein
VSSEETKIISKFESFTLISSYAFLNSTKNSLLGSHQSAENKKPTIFPLSIKFPNEISFFNVLSNKSCVLNNSGISTASFSAIQKIFLKKKLICFIKRYLYLH